MKKLLQCIILIALGLTINAQTTYVNINATGLNNGTSWANAYTDLHAATYNTTAGAIWVAQGTYLPTNNAMGVVPTNISQKTFLIKYNVKVYGGFIGTETALSQRDWKNNLTILSGQLNVSTQAYNVVKFDANSNVTVLDGFTIRDGRANGTTELFGGGIVMINSSSPTVRNCTLISNVAQQHGGAIHAFGGAPKFENCEFRSNSTVQYDGGAMYVNGATSTRIVNCLFNGNTAARHGGVMVLINTTTSKVWNCTFVNNQRGSGGLGGVILHSATVGSPVLSVNNSIFYNNLPSNNGSVDMNAGTYTAKNCYSNVGNLCFASNNGLTNIVTGAPNFTDYANGDFTLLCSSPAVNSADTIGLTIPSTDLNGDPRIVNTSIDMGAFENTQGNSTTLIGASISADQAGGTYRWLDCNNGYAAISGETGQAFTPTINGNYAVEITLNSCVDTSACVAVTSISINELTKSEVKLFPNPSSSSITIQTNETIQSVSVFNTLGTLVQTEKVNKFSIEQLPNGVYIVVVQTDKGVGTIRFIKE